MHEGNQEAAVREARLRGDVNRESRQCREVP